MSGCIWEVGEQRGGRVGRKRGRTVREQAHAAGVDSQVPRSTVTEAAGCQNWPSGRYRGGRRVPP